MDVQLEPPHKTHFLKIYNKVLTTRVLKVRETVEIAGMSHGSTVSVSNDQLYI